MIPGEYKLKIEDLECNHGKESITVKVGGNRVIYGLNNLTNGQINDLTKGKAMLNARTKGFI